MSIDRSKEKLRMFGRPIVSKLKNEVAKIPKNLLRKWFDRFLHNSNLFLKVIHNGTG